MKYPNFSLHPTSDLLPVSWNPTGSQRAGSSEDQRMQPTSPVFEHKAGQRKIDICYSPFEPGKVKFRMSFYPKILQLATHRAEIRNQISFIELSGIAF